LAIKLLHSLHIQILKHDNIATLGYRAACFVSEREALSRDFSVNFV